MVEHRARSVMKNAVQLPELPAPSDRRAASADVPAAMGCSTVSFEVAAPVSSAEGVNCNPAASPTTLTVL